MKSFFEFAIYDFWQTLFCVVDLVSMIIAIITGLQQILDGQSKKDVRKWICIVFTGIFLVTLVAMVVRFNVKNNATDLPCKVVITDKSIIMDVGEEFNISTTLTSASEDDVHVIWWESSDDSVASVDSYGHIKAINSGNAIIKVCIVCHGISAEDTCKVLVNNSISLSINNVPDTIYVGDVFMLAVDGFPEGESIIWSSSNPQVASISADGEFSSLCEGTTIVTASLECGSTTYSCTFLATIISPDIRFQQKNISLFPGEEYDLSKNVTTVFDNYQMRSSDSSIATIDNNGNLTAVGEGVATITVELFYQGIPYSDICSVQVTEPYIQIIYNECLMTVGDSCELALETIPDDLDVNWSSSDSTIIFVDSEGKVHAIQEGEAVITASVRMFNRTYESSVRITSICPRFDIEQHEVTLSVGQSEVLSYDFEPYYQEIVWRSSDTSVVSVNNGRITALSEGKATIYGQFQIGTNIYEDSIIVMVSSERSNPIAVSPIITSVTIDQDGAVTVAWDGIPNGMMYKVYIVIGASQEYKLVETTPYTSATIYGLTEGEYKLRVKGSCDGYVWTNLADCDYKTVYVN